MYKLLFSKLNSLLQKKVPATGIGLFRILYGLVTLQEIVFLSYFNHLIFDPIPYIDVEFPMVTFFLCLWGIIAGFIILGYRYQFAVISNYIFWIVFVNFTSMQRDFDGGFDLFMIGLGFFLLFMPGNSAFSIDNLRKKLSSPMTHYKHYQAASVSVLAYYIPIIVCLGFLYFDSAIHKLFAEHWRNGLGSWLPATQPYYVSALDMSVFLNNELLEKTIGYTILVFQFTFMFLFWHRRCRVIYLLIGMGLHLGITLSLNIYPFGMGMLMCYSLLIPFSWYRAIRRVFAYQQPVLTVFYDQLCPLCNRTVLILNHIDIFQAIEFKNAQEYARDYPALASITPETLLTDLYAVDAQQRVYAGLDTYVQIGMKMRYLMPISLLLSLPGIYQLAAQCYRRIAQGRRRLVPCDIQCLSPAPSPETSWYQQIFEQLGSQKPKWLCRKLTKILIAIVILQLNSTIHYGIVYRLHIDPHQNQWSDTLSKGSNALLALSQTFLGIAPHALYLHDHFAGYDRIIAITYTDQGGVEQWLPFVNEQGRLLAPNWGRVHSMWANIAVTPTINNVRLQKFIMKVTAFWGANIGLDINKTVFHIKLKKIDAPTHWVYNQLQLNFAAPWSTIGTVTWNNNVISFDIPKDINSL